MTTEFTPISTNNPLDTELTIITSIAFRARFPINKWQSIILEAQKGTDIDCLDLWGVYLANPAIDLRTVKSLVLPFLTKTTTYQLTQDEYNYIISFARSGELPLDLRYAQGLPLIPTDEEITNGI